MTRPTRRLVLVVRADPVICGHSGEARNLAEAALDQGFDDVRIITWPLDRLIESELPLKPLDSISPYREGITVERPEPVGNYKILDGRYLAGLTGRLFELFTDGVPTVCMSLYLTPHAVAVDDALRAAHRSGLPVRVVTIAEAVGSDITNVVRNCIESGRYGAAAHLLTTYLANDLCVAVSEYTRDLIVSEAALLDADHGTDFAEQCRRKVQISYPAIHAAQFTDLDPQDTHDALEARGLSRRGYVLFLSRLSLAKGVDDLIEGFARSAAAERVRLVVAGNGPEAPRLRELAAESPVADRVVFLDDVSDEEKPHLMAGCAAFVLPSKPVPEFVETFGIALAESMLAGGGPVITTTTGGIGEAVGDCALFIGVEDPDGIAAALDHAVLVMTDAERADLADRALRHALQFDRTAVYERLIARIPAP
ncbi:glycosyltransferase [Tessaracoccus sp. MC1627]|uniref:glycosyltransferase n=1 Tax=Tessaracoccus sp. MC1627 TaxID=2760312 RepID=UPI0016043937|nr:glycosyltransferase [Tessaracoccus sp. MC1627]